MAHRLDDGSIYISGFEVLHGIRREEEPLRPCARRCGSMAMRGYAYCHACTEANRREREHEERWGR